MRGVIAALSVALMIAALCAQPFSAAEPPVIGHIQGVQFVDGQWHVRGWACQRGIDRSISVHIYVDASAYATRPGKEVLSGAADQPSNEGVNRACGCSPNSRHSFDVVLPNDVLSKYAGHPLFVHGIRDVGHVQNSALAGSGRFRFPAPASDAEIYPPLSGRFSPTSQHPHVLISLDELRMLAERVNKADSYSGRVFRKLAAYVNGDVRSNKDWDATYSGDDIDIYLRAFSFESSGGYKEETRSDEEMRAALNVPGAAAPPRGAAIVAARAALYAALVQAGARQAPGDPSASDAMLLAKRILLAWSRNGFRDGTDKFLSSPKQFREGSDRSTRAQGGVGLQVSRGVIYSVYAQDMLMALGALNQRELQDANRFHSAMFNLIRNSINFVDETAPQECERFSNHTSNDLAAMLGIASLLNDERRFDSALYNNVPNVPVRIPWTRYFNNAIYGVNDRAIPCWQNSGRDGFTSRPGFQTSNAMPGELEDRVRNLDAHKAFGYCMFALERLYAAAEIMRHAGLDPYSYRGLKQESIEQVTQFYGCYVDTVGLHKEVTPENCRCGNCPQYVGKIFDDGRNFLTGAVIFPENRTIMAAARVAKEDKDTLSSATDPLLFGKWDD